MFACFLRLCYNNLLGANTGHTRKLVLETDTRASTIYKLGTHPEPYTQITYKTTTSRLFLQLVVMSPLPPHKTYSKPQGINSVSDCLHGYYKQDHLLLLMSITSLTGQISGSRS